MDFLLSVFLTGQRKDYIHHGLENAGLGSMRVQLEGNRVMVMALADEVVQYVDSLDQTAGRLQIVSDYVHFAIDFSEFIEYLRGS